jgi:hypothetical protein
MKVPPGATDTVYIIAYGRTAEISFSAGPLSLETLAENSEDLRVIGRAAGPQGQNARAPHDSHTPVKSAVTLGPNRSPGLSLLHAREDAQFAYRDAKLPTGPTYFEQGDTGIDHSGHFARLTAAEKLDQSICDRSIETINLRSSNWNNQSAIQRAATARASCSASVLKIEGTATSSAAITINSGNQTLEIGANGNSTINGVETIPLHQIARRTV